VLLTDPSVYVQSVSLDFFFFCITHDYANNPPPPHTHTHTFPVNVTDTILLSLKEHKFVTT